MSRKIYLASSWRNTYQPKLVADLREAGHEVYDFRNPGPASKGFGWVQIDPEWQHWTVEQFKEALKHPIAQDGHLNDHTAMEWCDTCVLLLPCGNSAHLEAGWCAGKGKDVVVYAPEIKEPDLMYLSLTDKSWERVSASMICTDEVSLYKWLKDR